MLPAKRRRTTRHSLLSPQLPSIWLDLLPSDVCDLIAYNISCGSQNDTAFNLALTSPTQCRSVVNSLSNTFQINSTFSHYPPEDWLVEQRWAKLFLPHIVRLDVRAYSREQYYACELLSAPTLETARILGEYRLLRSLLGSQVSELEIRACASTSAQLLCEVVAGLPLRKLTIICDAQDPAKCFYKNLSRAAGRAPSLTYSCPRVEQLGVGCQCTTAQHSLWTFVRNFSRIKELSIHNTCATGIHVFSNLCSFRMIKMQQHCEFPQCIRNLISEWTVVTSPTKAWNGTHVFSLKHCPKLSKLYLNLVEGAEKALRDVVLTLPSLSELSLSWEPKDHSNALASSTFGAILEAVRVAPNLSVLRLINVAIYLGELHEILKYMGPRLIRLETTLIDQAEHMPLRLASILETISKLNHRLQVLDVDIWFCDGGGSLARGELEVLHFWINYNLKKLQRCACIQNMTSLMDNVDSYFRDCYAHDDYDELIFDW